MNVRNLREGAREAGARTSASELRNRGLEASGATSGLNALVAPSPPARC